MKPIIFSGEMVRAILEGRKTQTRRVIKDSLIEYAVKKTRVCLEVFDSEINQCRNIYPRFKVGDILYVRETWMPYATIESWIADEQLYFYKADCSEKNLRALKRDNAKWRSPYHMPREAARIFLRVTDVRCERLQDITEHDARAEGARGVMRTNTFPSVEEPLIAFWMIWDGLNAKRGYGWDSNPWVFVYEFERCEKDGGDE